MATVTEIPAFTNEPFLDWNDAANVRRMETALEQIRSEFDRTWPLIIGGRRITDGERDTATSPSNPDLVVGYTVRATADHAREAIGAAAAAFQSWRKVSWEERADYLFRIADALRERRFEFAALMVYEVSKSWTEADADVAELIDFAEYYAREALRIGAPQPVVQYPGERDEMRYIPLGVGAVIPPWNFPAAIMGGMTMAAIVTGNTVVLKPAHTSSIIAAKFAELLVDDLGLPTGVLNFVPGPGSVIGDVIVDDPRTRFIAFTGSKEIGMRIYERAAKVQPGQIWLKRTILEMGGKDSIVVDETADLDAAAQGIVAAAFGFQGQKCSACSRAIIVDDVYDQVLDRVVAGAKQLTQGDPVDRRNFMGAVIDEKAFDKIREYIETGKKEGRLVLGGAVQDPEESGGYFIPPTIFADIAPDATLSQEEIFGPVLAFIKARDFQHAMEIFNNTEFGLTGSLYSTVPDRLERAQEDFHVGNLYLNRKCTGALVGVHPFGGFNMSGTDSKAGGPDYLLLFTQAKSIAEKIG
ncbi:MAG TPA: L-glutamate gamma-semialdehyde dehydrogenase [Longimicrobiales bacterium]|nr:L-glutamate gamma-semialdehyde dehydrogenase [Longimicrobiales bacterium]